LLDVNSRAIGVSGDGTTVAGYFFIAGISTPFRWTRAGGTVNLGLPPGTSTCIVTGISPDGNVTLAGCDSVAPTRWIGTAAPVVLGLPNGFTSATLVASSTTGSIITGNLMSPTGGTGLWPNGGVPTSLTLPPGITDSSPNAMSADGSVIVGQDVLTATSTTAGFRWTATTGIVTVPVPAGATDPNAVGVSADGTKVLIRTGNLGSFLWNVSLGNTTSALTPVGGTDFVAYALSADGTTALGTGNSGSIQLVTAGTVSVLTTVLQNLNVNLGTYVPAIPGSLSTNGKTVVGFGFDSVTGNNQGFVVVLP
jgi:uncharacterized membrane protein